MAWVEIADAEAMVIVIGVGIEGGEFFEPYNSPKKGYAEVGIPYE